MLAFSKEFEFMVGYRWTCNACGMGNEPHLSNCSSCGCSATAGSEEIEKHIDPEGFKKKIAKKKYMDILFFYFFIPMLSIIYVLSGKLESLVFLILIVSVSLTKNYKLLMHIFSDIWARNTALMFSGSYASLMLVRVFVIPNNSELVNWLAFMIGVLPIAFYFYFFKSQKGVQVFNRYYEKANK
ncbi:zinc finger Ran-binding domain-containing protein [Agarivorans aestuarii]|uniref:zinc finger Ran-binding domain-containing protein n=1 Tax=Agarivorans aestuarii TaxID=1563703 RepID=UPI001C8021EE|nr:zinc finger Ran-binding domain-containing protein [Agarivorans aestuarii]